MLALSPKVQKKAVKIAVVDNPTRLTPLSKEPPRIFAQTLHCQKLESLSYTSAADSMGPFRWAPKTVHNRSRSFKVVNFGTNRNGVCDFLLVTNSNLGPSLHSFWDTATYWPKIANFS